MQIENTFQVPVSRHSAWELLMDVPRVVPCMPGAELVEQVDESTWKATMAVKLGPISLTFATDVRREEADEAAGRMRLGANAREVRGRGAARATIESSLAEADGSTTVTVLTDLALSGAVAQYGRGMVQDVAGRLVASFAECLQAQLTAEPATAAAAVEAQRRPVSGLGLVLRALLGRVGRVFRRSGTKPPEATES